MNSPCETVAERVALGESLGELSTHVAQCADCQRTVQLPAQLGHTRTAIDPGLGFTARMTAGAQQRIALRKRRRIVASSGAAALAAALAVVVMTRPSEPPPSVAVQPQPARDRAPVAAEPDEIEQLVRMADTRRARRLSAHWSRIQRPLAPYRALVQRGTVVDTTPAVAPVPTAPAIPGEEP